MIPSHQLPTLYEVQAKRRFADRHKEMPSFWTDEEVYADLDRLVTQREARYDVPLGSAASDTQCALKCGVQAERTVLIGYRAQLDQRAAAQAVAS